MERNRKKSCLKITLLSSIVVIFISFMLWGLALILNLFPTNSTLQVKYIKDPNDVIIQTYHKGDKINLPESPSKFGYQFIGWSLKENEITLIPDEIVVERELTFYAKWQLQYYKLTYNGDLYELTIDSTVTTNGNSLEIITGENFFSFTPPARDGYYFAEWKISDGTEEFAISNFSLENVKSSTLTLIPIYKEILVPFNFETALDSYKITNISHNNEVWIKDTLSFDIKLDESVSNSEITIFATNGTVQSEKEKDVYHVSISDINQAFSISITGITLNEYKVQFYNGEQVTSEIFNHGEQLSFPSATNEGHKLIGFKDCDNRYYSSEYKVTSELTLYASWEEILYTIEFPKSNGMFVINYQEEFIQVGKTINKKHNDSLEFTISLSSAYNNSQISVYAETANGKIYPTTENNNYIFDKINADMKIVVENVELNSYNIIVDAVNYGSFGYGSWIYVGEYNLTIKDSQTGIETTIEALIADTNFGGWMCSDSIIGNCIVQDISDQNMNVVITGKYAQKVAKLHFVTNGGYIEKQEMIIVEGQEFDLPEPTKQGFSFLGWFTKLVEVNTEIDEESSERFTEITDYYIVLYAGWSKI